MMIHLLFILGISLAQSTPDEIPILPSPEKQREALEHNRNLDRSLRLPLKPPPVKLMRPYAEFEHARYLILSSTFNHDSMAVKKAIAKNLPDGVSLVVLVEDNIQDLHSIYDSLVGKDRLIVVDTADASGFWTRDSLPVPIFESFPNPFRLALTDAKYFHGYEPDQDIAKAFGADWVQHEFYYEGGNFLADNRGNCFTVDSGNVKAMADEVFSKYYGCASITRLPYVRGIGHIDERAKFLNELDVVTDEESYVPIFREKGYRVTLIPRANQVYETYANSLLVNGTLFLPIFSEAADEEVIKIYESFKLKVIPIKTIDLPNRGWGSIHCITMTYPDAPMNPISE